jgi:hypothetical protein
LARKRKSSGRQEDLFRIAAFMLFDALVFHQVLSNGHAAIVPPPRIEPGTMQATLRRQWLDIRDNIDYKPVFDLAIDIIDTLPPSPDTEKILSLLADAAVEAVQSGILLKHDFMGRIYHKLLLSTTGQYYATYYTSIPAAWLLTGLLLRDPNPAWNLGDIAGYDDFRLIDPACGSGTLLSASYAALKDQYIKNAPGALDVDLLHRILLSRTIHGWDVLDFAAHLSLTNLALHSDTLSADGSNIYRMPLGAQGGTVQLGSLEYLRGTMDLKGIALVEPVEELGFESGRQIELKREKFDVVIMNPPFSRSAKPNLSFGFSEAEARKRMQAALGALARSLGLYKAVVAGLTPFFMVLGLEMLKQHGRIGLVAPRSTLSGVGSRSARLRYEAETEIRYIVSNFDPGSRAERVDGWSWSENTDIGEILLVAQQRDAADPAAPAPRTLFVNILRKPRNEVEALILSQEVLRRARDGDVDLAAGNDTAISVLGRPAAILYSVPQGGLQGNWLAPCTFAAAPLNRLLLELRAAPALVGIERLLAVVNRELAMGRDIAAIKANFSRHPGAADARLVLGHQAAMNSLAMDARHIVHGKGRDAKSRKMFEDFGATLLLAERPHLKTESLLAMRAPERVLTTAFWELQLQPQVPEEWMLLWFNSTYGFMTYLAVSTSSQGDIFKMKKDQLRTLMVPAFEAGHGAAAAALYEAVSSEPFLPFAPEFGRAAAGGGARIKLDRFFEERLGLPRLTAHTYRALASDPVVSRSSLV